MVTDPEQQLTEGTEGSDEQVVAAQLRLIEQAARQDAEANYRVGDNHLLHADRVIAGLAALESIAAPERLIEMALRASEGGASPPPAEAS